MNPVGDGQRGAEIYRSEIRSGFRQNGADSTVRLVGTPAFTGQYEKLFDLFLARSPDEDKAGRRCFHSFRTLQIRGTPRQSLLVEQPALDSITDERFSGLPSCTLIIRA